MKHYQKLLRVIGTVLFTRESKRKHKKGRRSMSKMTQSIVTVKREVRLEEWKQQVAACAGSGLSVRQWCTQEGIAPGTY